MESITLAKFLTRRMNFLLKIALPPVFILIIHFILSFNNVYFIIEWIDMPMHFLGGASIGITYTLLLIKMQKDNYLGKIDKIMMLVFILSMIGLTAILWEFLEFSFDYIFGTTMQPNLTDTMMDIFLGLFGGKLSCLITLNQTKNY